MSRRVVRCPRCGSTDAGEVDGRYEFTRMRCAACGYEEVCDPYAVVEDWNVDVDLAAEAPLPAWLPPRRG